MRALRGWVTTAHRWLGLTLGLIVVYLALTGAAIVFRPQADALANPGLMTVTPCTAPLSIDAIASAARAAHPSGRLTYVYVYGSPTASAMVRFSDTDQVYVNPCSATVLGHQLRYGGIFGALEGLHKVRFAGALGIPAIGWVALALATLMVLGGLFMWWPRRRGNLSISARLRGRPRALNVHMTVGLYSAIVVFMVAATAVPLSLPWAKGALFSVTRSDDFTEEGHLPGRATPARVENAARISMQQAFAETRARFPGEFEWASVRYPAKKGPVEVGIVLAGAVHGDARNYAFVDRSTGKILEARPWQTLNAGSKAYYWALALHTGRFGGPIVRTLMLLAMIGLAAIGYTGIESYIRKVARRRAPLKTLEKTSIANNATGASS